ncbi:hypothetical protein E0F89_14910 [Flavobacterium caseinilyticum]|uniref:Uncharacterized protein n=1 Tax=Flavobacterium caseinilyticum TaxID=2541732 RepID=A0A4R5ARS4_9FLAO|nr:hypothetical protein E0F89_14910 [Flavobacterium caseinilyticum]
MWRFFYFIQYQYIKNNTKIKCKYCLENSKLFLYLHPVSTISNAY